MPGTFLVILFAIIAFNASACPSSDKKLHSVQLGFQNGFRSVFDIAPSGNVLISEFDQAGKLFEVREEAGGVFPTRIDEYEDGEITYSFSAVYSFQLSPYLPPTLGLSIRGRQIEKNSYGEYENRYRLKIAKEQISVKMGECTFDAWKIEHIYGRWWDDDRDRALYFPSIGISVPFEWDYVPNWERLSAGNFTYAAH